LQLNYSILLLDHFWNLVFEPKKCFDHFLEFLRRLIMRKILKIEIEFFDGIEDGDEART